MGVERIKKVVEVDVVRCDWLRVDELLGVATLCDRTTTNFTSYGVDHLRGEDTVLNGGDGWLELTGRRRWFFCSLEHMLEWLRRPGVQMFFDPSLGQEDDE